MKASELAGEGCEHLGSPEGIVDGAMTVIRETSHVGPSEGCFYERRGARRCMVRDLRARPRWKSPLPPSVRNRNLPLLRGAVGVGMREGGPQRPPVPARPALPARLTRNGPARSPEGGGRIISGRLNVALS
jgi:hypothetical protein